MSILKKKLPGGALLFALIISALLLILTSSIISINYYYSLKYAYNVQLNSVKNNVESALNLALSDVGNSKDYSIENNQNTIDLFGKGTDSVKILRWNFGLFDGFEVEAHYKNVLISKKALAGNEFGEASVFYLADHGHSISISGKTEIYENVFFPKSGFQPGYISGNSLNGDPVRGPQQISKELPPLSKTIEDKIKTITESLSLNDSIVSASDFMSNDTIRNSFSNPAIKIHIKGDFVLSNKYIDGNVSINCSGKLKIRKNCVLRNVILVARYVEFEKETISSCQVFASDTILTDEKCIFNYPSTFVLSQQKNRAGTIILGKENSFNGSIIGLKDKNTINVPFSFRTGDASLINGQIYFAGPSALNGELNGDIYIEQSFVNTGSAVYDNFLYNISINKNKINRRFCYIKLLDKEIIAEKQKRSILKWIS